MYRCTRKPWGPAPGSHACKHTQSIATMNAPRIAARASHGNLHLDCTQALGTLLTRRACAQKHMYDCACAGAMKMHGRDCHTKVFFRKQITRTVRNGTMNISSTLLHLGSYDVAMHAEVRRGPSSASREYALSISLAISVNKRKMSESSVSVPRDTILRKT